jgi:hypothetical protein
VSSLRLAVLRAGSTISESVDIDLPALADRFVTVQLDWSALGLVEAPFREEMESWHDRAGTPLTSGPGRCAWR